MASTAREAAAADLAPEGLPPAASTAPVPVPRAPLLMAVALAVAGAFLIAMLSATSGRFVPQVLDLYLVAQYAKAMAQGHP
ncbi:MAG TPA: hypothetical protein VFO85_20040, partial [Vicinamibacteria bacterium]|nr:hypothetical protein [Vicinamibacteria bacterium]